MTITTRAALPSDTESIAAIYNQGIVDRIATFETELRTPQSIERQLQERGQRFPTIVAEVDGFVIAWAGASPYSARPCYAGIAEFSMYVQRDCRGKGAGQAVLSALIELCERMGIWKLVSRIFPENQASLRLCQRLGFREVGIYRRHARLDGEWRDCVIVEKLLGGAVEE